MTTSDNHRWDLDSIANRMREQNNALQRELDQMREDSEVDQRHMLDSVSSIPRAIWPTDAGFPEEALTRPLTLEAFTTVRLNHSIESINVTIPATISPQPIATPQGATFPSVVTAQGTPAPAQASEVTTSTATEVPELDPNSDEAKRKEIEKRLQEIRGTMGAGFGDVMMQPFVLYPTHVEAQVGNIRKTISILDFKQILDGFIKLDAKIENMQMPYGTFMFGKANGDIQISCYYPSRRAKLKHLDRHDGQPKEFNVVLPNIIISHKIKLDTNEWRVTDTHYFCTDRKVTTLPEGEFIWQADAKKGIYAMPLPNFYPEGRMCFGNNTMPKRFFNNLNGLDYYYQIIEIAPFNNDLGVRGVRNTDTPRTWFHDMEKMSDFDYSRLSGYVSPPGGIAANTMYPANGSTTSTTATPINIGTATATTTTIRTARGM